MRKSDFIFKYRVRNWPAYNRALVRRGSITFRVDEAAVQAWRDSAAPGLLGGRRRTYSDTAIECVLVVRTVFHLSLRASQGFLESVVKLMGSTFRSPTTRRLAGDRPDLPSSWGPRGRARRGTW